LLLVVGAVLMLAWKVAGYIGADYFLLRFLGVPWKSKDAEAEAPPQVQATPAK
jgi:hypothetical protein